MKPFVQFLSEKEVHRLHAAALDILDGVGMRIFHDKALELLENAGARVDSEKVARISAHLVEKALEAAPERESVVLFARDPEKDVDFKGHDPALACMTMAVHVMDPVTRKKRLATKADLAALTRIADKLDNIRVNGGLVTPQDVPKDFNDWHTWSTTLQNTSKHVTGGMFGKRCVADAVQMGAIAAGGEDSFRKRPFISGWVLSLPPLSASFETVDSLMEMARLGIPVMISSGPILGTSSPVTIAGTIAQAHAEILGLLVVCQLAGPGCPVVYTSFARGMDMGSGNISMAGPEFGILKGAMAQMGRFLSLPVRMPGMLRDAKMLDAQAGFETGMIGAVSGLCADVMDGMQLDMDLVVDYPDLVFCDDCAGAVRRLARPLEVNDETLALEVIRETGPGGSYLDHGHTFEHFRGHLFMPRLFERRNWSAWEADGMPDIIRVAEKRARELLEQGPDHLLPEKDRLRINEIVESAERGKA